MLLTLATTGCDPCAGVAGCTTNPTVSISGQVVEFGTSKGVQGVEVTFYRDTLQPATAWRTTTDAGGYWKISASPDSARAITGTVEVKSGAATYRVSGVVVQASTVRGEGAYVGRWFSVPQLLVVGQVTSRQLHGALVGATVRVVPHAGSSVQSAPTLVTSTGQGGDFYAYAPATAGGSVVADVTIQGAGLTQPVTFFNMQFPVTHRDTIATVNGTYVVGTSLAYVGEVYLRGTGQALPGVQATLTRVSGIGMTPSVVPSISDAVGRFPLTATPAGDGQVVADLVLTPPTGFGAQRTIRGLVMQTFDEQNQRLLGRWGVGEQARYVGELFDRGSLLSAAGVRVEFRRTGGIAGTDSGATSIEGGRFLIAPGTTGAGEIVGDLYFNFRPPRAPEVVRGLHLRTFDDDSLRYLQRWGVGPSLQYQGEVRAEDDTPLNGVITEWRRVSGIAVAESVVVSRSNLNGRFLMNPTPSVDGDVVGALTLRPPAPYRDTTIVVRMSTFLDDQQHLGGVYRLLRPR
jgi:hypothetical protein